MENTQAERSPGGRRRRLPQVGVGATIVIALLAMTGVAAATYGVTVRGGNGSGAVLKCPGGMDRMSHVLDANVSVFPGDPPPIIDIIFSVENDGFLVEEVTVGTHTSTHIDAPIHFGYTASIDDFAAEDFVFPAYVIDARDRVGEAGVTQLSWDDIRDYERENGRIARGSMVIVWNGIDGDFGTDAYVNADAVGFSEDAVQRLFDDRHVAGIGSDWFGPDAAGDDFFLSTNKALENEGLVLTNLNNIATMNVKGDIIISSAVPLIDGSGYQVDPLVCHGRSR